MDFGEFIAGFATFDLLVVLYFGAFFVLGYFQGTIRRLLGIASILFSFLVAANLREPLGQFLAGAIAFTLVIQGFYKTQPLFEKQRFADELLGGLLGILQAAIILGCAIVILDSFFVIPGIPQNANELPLLREFWTALDTSNTGQIFRDTIIPAFFAVSGPFVPGSIRQLFPG